MKYMFECAEGAIDSHIESERKKHAEKVKAVIRNRVPLLSRTAQPYPAIP
jgi:hypothetical protein